MIRMLVCCVLCGCTTPISGQRPKSPQPSDGMRSVVRLTQWDQSIGRGAASCETLTGSPSKVQREQAQALFRRVCAEYNSLAEYWIQAEAVPEESEYIYSWVFFCKEKVVEAPLSKREYVPPPPSQPAPPSQERLPIGGVPWLAAWDRKVLGGIVVCSVREGQPSSVQIAAARQLIESRCSPFWDGGIFWIDEEGSYPVTRAVHDYVWVFFCGEHPSVEQLRRGEEALRQFQDTVRKYEEFMKKQKKQKEGK